jgi:hypothetical protein
VNKNSETNPKTPPLKQLNFKVSADLYWKLKNHATSKRLKMAEVLEKSFEFYQKKEQLVKEINTYRQTIPAVEQQMKPFLESMSLMEVALRINNLIPEHFNRIGLVNTYQVLKETLSEWFRLEKEKRGL